MRAVTGKRAALGVAVLAAMTGRALGQSWSASNGNLWNTAAKTGIGTNIPQFGKLEVQSAGEAIVSIYGLNYANTGNTRGFYGEVRAPSGIGGVGYNTATTGTAMGLWGGTQGNQGIGVYGIAYASAGQTRGVYGEASNSNDGVGVFGVGTRVGVQGQSKYPGYGWAGAFYGNTYLGGDVLNTGDMAVQGDMLVQGDLLGSRIGIGNPTPAYPLEVEAGFDYGFVQSNGAVSMGLYSGNWIGTRSNDELNFFTNDGGPQAILQTNGQFYVGNSLVGPGKQFLIDHPSDPANKTLRHGSIETNEWANMYRGNVQLDGAGRATVTLPSWMEDLNENFTYQLTCIGGFAPVYVAEEISHGQFQIAGGTPGLKVSWVVSGTRKDAWARANPIEVEEDKGERGKYLQPAAFGLGDEQRMGARRAGKALPGSK